MDLTKEIDSQPLTQAFSFMREKQKAMHGLKGILTGIVADQRLNEKEFLFLDVWLKSQQYLAEDEDVVNILSQVGDILEDGHISSQELLQMQSSIEKVIAHKNTDDSELVNRVDELVGFLAGIAADGVLNDSEIAALADWLDANESIKEKWPASVIVNRLADILEDGIVTDEEREDLLNTANQFIGPDFDSKDVTIEASTAIWEDKIDSLTISGATFCLTGDFVSGDRYSVDTMLHCLGAETKSNMDKEVDYLVIGTLASKDWLYTSHGRKIEKALLLKRKGVNVVVITERTLLKFTHQ